MTIKYHIGTDGRGRIIDGTPVARQSGEILKLIFDVDPDLCYVFINGKRIAAAHGYASVSPTDIAGRTEVRLQYTKGKITHTVFCEALIDSNGVLIGEDELDLDPIKVKHQLVETSREHSRFAREIEDLKKKIAALEIRLSGTDIFDLNEE
jgi:hypothetical protein